MKHYKKVLKCEINRHTLIGPRIPHKLPRRNLVVIAIQKFTLRPKSVLNINLKLLPNGRDIRNNEFEKINQYNQLQFPQINYLRYENMVQYFLHCKCTNYYYGFPTIFIGHYSP